MSTTKTILELAAGYAAGTYTEDALMEVCGDDSIVSDIISIAGGLVGAGLVAGATSMLLDTEIATDVTDVVDEALDGIGEAVSGLNPFSW